MVDKKQLLIIEDEPSMLRILTDKLTESGYQVIQSTNGEEGLEMAMSKHPDLILVDVLMPKLDGIAMMNKLREDPWGKDVPVIVLTNVSADSDDTLQAIVKNQPAYYLVKSNTELSDIAEKINDILAPAPAPAPASTSESK